ncbi:MAG: acetyl-CoA carboxylase carboxyltransferase subunit alpha [Acidobacteria bacterium]|nr:acetyl-CoA carboxylase carboxyltransferase subunit alpha [Acidobacteriota bacterium]
MSNVNKNAFERVQEARNPDRPYSLDLLRDIFTDFVELHGDRRYSDDAALVAGLARLGDLQVAVIGQQKGRDINERRYRNFAMTKPEGYRKAVRIMRLAEKFGRPLVAFVDTPGAYPGIDAEERGQAEAIAYNLREMANLRVPTVVVVVGEGGSGGALAIGVGDYVLMMENAVYSVITPEGCAAILWKDSTKAPRAAESLRLTAADLKSFGLVDEIVSEGDGWKVRDDSNVESVDPVTRELGRKIDQKLRELLRLTPEELLRSRFRKFRKMGRWVGGE